MLRTKFRTKKYFLVQFFPIFMSICLTLGVFGLMPSTQKVHADSDVTMTFTVKGWVNSTSSSRINDETSGVSDTGIAAVMNHYYPKTGRVHGVGTNSDENFYIFNTDEIPGSITSITITGSTDDSNYFQNNMYAAVGCESQSNVTESEYGVAGTGSKEGFSWSFSGDEGYTYFKLYSNERFIKGTTLVETVITVTYTPKTTDRKLDSIYIDGTASKLQYNVGEEFDPTGLKVMGRYDDILGDTEITSGITWSFEPETLSADTTQVSVTAQFKDFTSEEKIVNNFTVAIPVHVYDILPPGFPSGAPSVMKNGWTNGNSKIVLYQDALYLDNDELLSKNKILTESDGNYFFIDSVNGKYFSFYMKDGVLEKINLLGFTSSQNGDYVPQPTVAEIDCPTCHGDGLAQCSECYGLGCSSCNGGNVPCTNCGETGKISFTTLEDAISAVSYYGKITLLKDNSEEIEISKEAVFIIDKGSFTFDKTKITAGTGYDVSTREDDTGTTFIVTHQKTIASILPEDFPTFSMPLPSNAWENRNCTTSKLYKNLSEGLTFGSLDTFDNFDHILNSPLTKVENGYELLKDSYTIKFDMISNELVSITLSGSAHADVNGVYTPHMHNMEHHEAVAPTCTEDGTVEYWTCPNESGVYFANAEGTETLSSIVDSKLGHVMEHHEAVAPTCTKDGNVEYWTCSHESGVYYVNEARTATLSSVVDPKIGHHYSGEVSYTWNNNQCTASWHCDHDGCEEVESETVTGVYVKDSDATTESNEKGHYVATFSISEFATNSTAPNSVEIPDSKLSTKGLSGGAIAGIVIGSVFGLLIIAFAVLYILWKRKNLNVPILSKVLTPAFRFINKLFFKTKLNDVEAKEAENKVMKE